MKKYLLIAALILIAGSAWAEPHKSLYYLDVGKDDGSLWAATRMKSCILTHIAARDYYSPYNGLSMNNQLLKACAAEGLSWIKYCVKNGSNEQGCASQAGIYSQLYLNRSRGYF